MSTDGRKTIEQIEEIFKLLEKIDQQPEVIQKKRDLAFLLAAAYGDKSKRSDSNLLPSAELKANAGLDVNRETPLLERVESKTDHGDPLAPDEFKANYYLAKALLLQPPEKSTASVLSGFSWFTTIRLGVLREDRRKFPGCFFRYYE